MSYKKGDLVIVNGYATGYGSHKDIRGIVINDKAEPEGEHYGVAQVLINGKVVFMPIIHIKHAEHNDAKGTHIQAR